MLQSYKFVLNRPIMLSNFVKYLSLNNFLSFIFLTYFIYHIAVQNVHNTWRLSTLGFTSRLECDGSLM